MANCMIQSKGLSLKYWAESINCANYIVNRTPTKDFKNITMEEAWTKTKLDLSHFRVFGNIAWAHILDEKRKALQPKSEKCIFVGYYEYVKGYRLLQTHCNEIIIIRDVKFDENTWSASLIRRLCLLWLAILIQQLCLLQTASHLRHLCLLLFWFLL
jgi:hypothetical protein